MKLSIKNMFLDRLGSGLSLEEFTNLKPKLAEIKSSFLANKAKYSYREFADSKMDLSAIYDYKNKLDKSINTIVVIGIGGSDLGARAVHAALNSQYYNEQKSVNYKIYFSGDTTDPKNLLELTEVLDISKALFIVISKSGNTIEQASAFIYFRKLVISSLGEAADIKHFLFITDSKTGTLRELADKYGYPTLAIPANIGGRFSVLSTVGLVPALFAGIKIEELLKGAEDLKLELESASVDNDMALTYAALNYLYFNKGKNISVLMPYQYSLHGFAFWYRQLWAESLGKKLTKDNQVVNTGSTPIAALGPTDQHSQLQLYNEGPNDKIFTFIVAKNTDQNITLPSELEKLKQFEFLAGSDLQSILNYEQKTTAFALTKNERPNCTIEIDKVNEYNLGQLIYFFEAVVGYLGDMYNIDAFDQPGVELSKNAMFGILGKAGYEDYKEEFEKGN